jgi:hypothetical protein
MAELNLGMRLDIGLEFAPYTLVIPDFPAGGACRQETAQSFDLAEQSFQFLLLFQGDDLVRHFGKRHIVADQKELVVPVFGHFFAAHVKAYEPVLHGP